MPEPQSQQPQTKTPFQPGEPFDFGNREVLLKCQSAAAYIATFDNIQDAYALAKIITVGMRERKDLFEKPSSLSKNYHDILNLMRAVAIPSLDQDTLKSFFREGVANVLRNKDIDLTEKIEAKFTTMLWAEERDDFKQKLRYELRQNYERLTFQPIRTTIGVTAPTVKEWLAIAERHEEPDEPLSVAIIDDPIFEKLSKEEQDVVGRLLALDDMLALSSATAEGFENAITIKDEAGKRWIIDHGEILPAVDDETKVLIEQFNPRTGAAPQPSAALPASVKETGKPTLSAQEYASLVKRVHVEHTSDDEARYDEQEKMLEKVGTDVPQLVKKFEEALLVNDSKASLACLGVLSRFGTIHEALNSKSVQDAFVEEFLKPLAVRSKVSMETAKAAFEKSKDAPQHVGAFLEWALNRALIGNEKESARIGNQMAATLAALGNPSYVNMTYFDVQSGEFKWTPLKMKQDGMLEWVE